MLHFTIELEVLTLKKKPGNNNKQQEKRAPDVNELVKSLYSSDQGIRMDAVMKLGKLQNPNAIEPLIRILQTDVHSVSGEAGEALAMIGSPAVEPLIKLLKSSDSDVQQKAASALGVIKDKRAVPALIDVLKMSNNKAVLHFVITGLGKIGDERSVIPLSARLTEEHDVQIRSWLENVLAKLDMAPVTNMKVITPELVTPNDRFELMKSFELTVPLDYDHGTQLATFAAFVKKKLPRYHEMSSYGISDINFAKATQKLVPGKTYQIKIFRIMIHQVTADECLAFLATQRAILVGAQGLSLAWQLKNEEFPVGKAMVSFDKKNALRETRKDEHEVPDIFRTSEDNWVFSCCNFDYHWKGSDSCLICFCELSTEKAGDLGKTGSKEQNPLQHCSENQKIKFKTHMAIGKSLQDVWDYFIIPSNWGKWWGFELTEVNPAWEKDGKLHWQFGETSTITDIVMLKEITIRSRWDIQRWTFNDLNGEVLLEVEAEILDTLTSSETIWQEEWQFTLNMLKQGIEN